MLRTLLLSTLAAALTAAPGTLVLGGKSYALTHVYARKGPNAFEPKKISTYVLAADRELSPAERTDGDAIRELAWEGKLNGIEIELTDGGISWSIKTNQIKASMSGSQTPDPYKLTVAADRITGTVKMEKPEKLGETEYFFAFDIDAPIEVKVEPPPPTAADKAAAQNAASAKAYKAYLAVLMKGDKAALMKAVDPEKAKMIDTPEFPQMLKFIQSMQPKNIQILRASEAGGTAELAVSGNAGADVGTVKMQKIGDAWVVMKESWKSR
ncbi:MAG: hypothetical protein HYX27_04125 [Acidobacteria bacterium]|nr:hypothetical protein [Acidobacteriota bacterium]